MDRCYFYLNVFLVISIVVFSSCNQQKIEDLQHQNISLEKQTSKFQKSIEALQGKLNVARDSIYSLQLKVSKYENPPEKFLHL